MRGGLDDALDKLARRDELRRRAAGEATGTPPAVQELVEAIAAVVNRNQELAVTVGVEGVGDPVLLHFLVEDSVVQVSVDKSVVARVTETAPSSPKHADFDIDLEDPAEEPYPDYPASGYPTATPEPGPETRRVSYDDRDRYDPGTGYTTSAYGETAEPTASPAHSDDRFFANSATSDQRYERHRRYDDAFSPTDFFPLDSDDPPRESAFPTRDGVPYSRSHPFAATPPVPPQTSRWAPAEQHHAGEDPTPPQPPEAPAHQPPAQQPPAQQPPAQQPPAQRGMPTPLPNPIPLKVDTQETELAAKRLAALLRDNPTLLRQAPPD